MLRFLTLVLASLKIILRAGAQGSTHVTYHPFGPNGQAIQVYGQPTFGNLEIFYQIPFAEPPVGHLRFKPPQPLTTVPAVINEKSYSDGCMQGPVFGQSLFSEDCLYLNVWRPQGYNETSNLPVLVWLYGGGYVNGFAQAFTFNEIMEAGVKQVSVHQIPLIVSLGTPFIVVNGNYRLGPFGFGYGQEYLADGASNSGLWDVLAVLDWVQANIASFGGNPDHVTLAGQSAGAVSASLMALVSNPPNIVGIILNDGAPGALPLAPTIDGFPDLYPLTLNLTNCSGAADTFECLRTVDVNVLNDAFIAIRQMPKFLNAFPWAPNVDNKLIPDRPSTLLHQGRFLKVPMMLGDNNDEGTSFVLKDTNSTQSVIDQINDFEPVKLPNETMTQLLELYPNDPAVGSPYGTGNDTFGLDPHYKQVASVVGDILFQHPRRYMLEKMNDNGLNETWTWLFDAFPFLPASGVPHTWDTAWFLGQVSNTTYNPGGPAFALSNQTMQYWLNFIIHSDPNGLGESQYAHWPKYRDNGQIANMLKFTGNETGVGSEVVQDDYRKEQIDFINQHPVKFNA